MQSPVRIQVGLTAPPARAEQKLYHVQEPDKMPLLLDLLARSEGRVLVFARTKRKVDRLARTVSARRHNVARIHGDREQTQRDAAMAGFRNGQYRILIATDIAARGIDVADIEHVINYDFPGCAEDYIHRIGRTARVAAKRHGDELRHAHRPPLPEPAREADFAKLPLTHIGSSAPEEPAQASAPAEGQRRRRSRGGRSHRGGRGRSQHPVAQAS